MGSTGWLREQCAAPILGSKRVPWRGKQRTEQMIERIEFVHKSSQELRLSLGNIVYEDRIKAIKEKLCVTFTSERKQEAKEKITAVLNQPHIPSAKELVSGIHYSAMALGLLQFGKVHANQGNNYNLYKDEIKGRVENTFGEVSRNEENRINKMNTDQAKKWIRVDEGANHASEYEDGYDNRFFKPRFTQYGDWTWKRT
jgi:hypothetical protein